MSKIISVVGIVLIAGAGVVTAISSSKEDVLKSKKAFCAKYTKNSELALQSKDYDKAFKFAKLAIKADPENKSGYKILSKIIDAKSQGNVPASTGTSKATLKPNVDSEEEMGC